MSAFIRSIIRKKQLALLGLLSLLSLTACETAPPALFSQSDLLGTWQCIMTSPETRKDMKGTFVTTLNFQPPSKNNFSNHTELEIIDLLNGNNDNNIVAQLNFEMTGNWLYTDNNQITIKTDDEIRFWRNETVKDLEMEAFALERYKEKIAQIAKDANYTFVSNIEFLTEHKIEISYVYGLPNKPPTTRTDHRCERVSTVAP